MKSLCEILTENHDMSARQCGSYSAYQAPLLLMSIYHSCVICHSSYSILHFPISLNCLIWKFQLVVLSLCLSTALLLQKITLFR